MRLEADEEAPYQKKWQAIRDCNLLDWYHACVDVHTMGVCDGLA